MISDELNLGPDAEGSNKPLKAALIDVWMGLRLYPIWIMLAWQDIRQRYRRSVIGPFWLTISMGIMVASLGVLYAGLFKQEIHSYLPYLAIGLIIWSFLSTIFLEACTVFIGVEGMMKQLRLPLTLHVCRMVWRNLIILAHSFVIIIFVMIWAGIPITMDLWSLPGAIFLYCANAICAGLVLGILCVRYRDVPPLVGNLVQLLFFVTPIMWSSDVLIERSDSLAWVVKYNPAFHFIEIFRSPLLGMPLPFDSWMVVLATTGILWVLAIYFLKEFRAKVTYWL